MRACQLVGKTALRSKPVDLGNGHKDYSYSGGTPVLIKSYDGSHVEIKSNISGMGHYLDSRWDDDNWMRVPPADDAKIKCPPYCPHNNKETL